MIVRGESGSRKTAATFNKSVHGARGLLALLVFIFHVACSGMQGLAIEGAALPHAALMSLQFGVEMFFCISGYIVVGALRRAASPARFMLDRASRILPVLWLTLAVIIPLGLATHQSQVAGLTAHDLAWIVPANLVPLAGVLPIPVLHMAAWSLSYEFAFYLLAAALWWLPARQTFLRVCVGCLAAALTIWHPRALFFAVGVLVARTDLTRHAVLRHVIRAPGLALLAFFACWYVVQFGGGAGGDATMLAWIGDGRLGLAAVAVSAAILGFSGIVAGHGVLGLLLRAAPFQWLGTVSYSFYLWHLIVLAIAKRALAMSGVADATGSLSQIVLFTVCLPVSLVVARLSWRLVEQGSAAWLKQHAALLGGGLSVPRRGGVVASA